MAKVYNTATKSYYKTTPAETTQILRAIAHLFEEELTERQESILNKCLEALFLGNQLSTKQYDVLRGIQEDYEHDELSFEELPDESYPFGAKIGRQREEEYAAIVAELGGPEVLAKTEVDADTSIRGILSSDRPQKVLKARVDKIIKEIKERLDMVEYLVSLNAEAAA